MKPWIFILVGVALVACAFLYGKSVGKDLKENEVLKVQQEAANQAREDEREKQAKINEGLQVQVNEQININKQLTTDIVGLRKRANRAANKGARTQCKGTTGADLSAQDAEFLAREAARADQIRAGLKACYHYADSLQ